MIAVRRRNSWYWPPAHCTIVSPSENTLEHMFGIWSSGSSDASRCSHCWHGPHKIVPTLCQRLLDGDRCVKYYSEDERGLAECPSGQISARAVSPIKPGTFCLFEMCLITDERAETSSKWIKAGEVQTHG